ncbi:MAG: head-tail connector protein [Psychrilyobacter sp.]|uniref:head-tail connector protein n=1 Tax=Psychrilyobacter sp. TaxID=2586924 RepID=UPI003C709FF3
MTTLAIAKLHMRIDYDDEDSYIETLIETSEIYIDSMAGEMYKEDEKAVKLADLLQLKLINDMFTNRGSEISSNLKTDIITTSILDKLSNYS